MALTDQVDASLIDKLLYGSEGVDLDFKRDQYPFEGASDFEKGDLLKDILAFANAFRRSTAYILIGVDEVDCGRAKVVGVLEHLKDADLQQFVNGKTNRDVVFSYQSLEYEEKQIGVIRIVEQQRPIYLRKDFGHDPSRNRHKVKANVVYFRVGSSTKEASPEDIARMGSHSVRQPLCDVNLQFANFRDRTVAGILLKTSHDFLLYEGVIHDFTSYVSSDAVFRSENAAYHFSLARTERDNPEFWRQAYEYIRCWNSLAEVGFCIENRGDVTIDDVTVEIALPIDAGFLVIAENKMPEKPEAQYSVLYPRLRRPPVLDPKVCVERRGDWQVVTLWFGKVQTGQRSFLPDALYLGNAKEKHVIIDAVVRADQFPSPLLARLELHARGTESKVEWDELKVLIEDYFFRSDDES